MWIEFSWFVDSCVRDNVLKEDYVLCNSILRMITLLHNQRPNIPFNMHLELIPFIDSAVVKSELQDLVCDFQKKMLFWY